MIKKLLVVCILWILSTNFLYAEKTYSLQQMIDHGLQTTYDVQTADLTKKTYTSSARSSIWAFLPIDNSLLQHKDTEAISYKKQTSFRVQKSISLTDPLFFSAHRAWLYKAQNDVAHNTALQHTVYQIISDYISVLAAQDQYAIAQKTYALQKRIHEKMIVKFQSQTVSFLEKKQSELDLLNYQIQYIEAENDLKNQRDILFQYVNIPDNNEELLPIQADINQNIPAYTENNATRIQEYHTKIARVSHTEALLRFLPTLRAGASIMHTNTDEEHLWNNEYYTRDTELKLELSYSLFALAEKREACARARYALKKETLALQDTREKQKQVYDRMVRDIMMLSSTYELYEQQRELAKENREIAEKEWQRGIINLIDFDKSKLAEITAQKTYITQYYLLLQKQEQLKQFLSLSPYVAAYEHK